MSASDIPTVPSSEEGITQPWIQQVFNNIDPGLNITQVDIKGPIGQGQGYMNDLVAVDVTGNRNGRDERYSVVAKMTSFRMLEVAEVAEDFCEEDYVMFDTAEAKFYSIAVPDFLSLQTKGRNSAVKVEDKAFGTSFLADTVPVPKCYFTASDLTSRISVRVLDNLKTQGFSVKTYPQTFDFDEMMLTAGALAQVHGLSHRLELQSGTRLPDMYDWMMDLHATKQQSYAKWYEAGLEEFAAAFPGHEDLLASLRKLNVETTVIDVVKNPDRVKVLSHADCWNNNIMFKYEEGKAVDIKLIDWQTCSYRPPTYDLLVCFMLQSWDIFHNHRDAILEHYHQELQKTLGGNKSAGLHLYTLEELKADFRADSAYGVYERMVYGAALFPRQQPDLLRIVQEIKNWGVI